MVRLGTALMKKSAPVPTFTFSQLDLRRTIVRTCVAFYFFFQTLWSFSHATMLLQILVLADIIGSAWPEAGPGKSCIRDNFSPAGWSNGKSSRRSLLDLEWLTARIPSVMSRFNVLCCWDHSMHLCPWSNSKMLEYSQFMTTCHMIIPCKALQCEPSFAQFCLHFMFSVALAAGQCSYVIPLHILSPSPVWWKTFSDKALSMAGTLCLSNIVQIDATADQETFCVDFSRRWNIRVET